MDAILYCTGSIHLILPEFLYYYNMFFDNLRLQPCGHLEKRKAAMTTFGEKVKTRREELQLGQEQLGGLIGVSRRTIVSYETGGKFPREATLRKLAGALGITERYLRNDDCSDPQAGIDEEPFIQAARDSFGKKGAEEMAALLKQNQALFAGGSLRSCFHKQGALDCQGFLLVGKAIFRRNPDAAYRQKDWQDGVNAYENSF